MSSVSRFRCSDNKYKISKPVSIISLCMESKQCVSAMLAVYTNELNVNTEDYKLHSYIQGIRLHKR